MNVPNREVFGTGRRGGHLLVPEIIETGWGQFSSAHGGHLKPHAHSDAFELCLILSGEVEWLTAESSDVLRAGDIYLSQPDEVHWGRDSAMHPCTLHWLILGSYDRGYDWHGLDRETATFLDTQLRGIRTNRLRGTAKMHAAFKNIFEEHRHDVHTPDGLLLKRGNVRAALHSLLIELVRTYDQQYTDTKSQNAADQLPEQVANVIELLSGTENDRDTVSNICRSIGVEYTLLNRQFVDSLGISIPQYWLRERVRRARASLRDTDSTITDVAIQFGFSSSQHFATVFRKVTGLTPSEYRATVAE